MGEASASRESDVGDFGQLLRRVGVAGPIEYAFQFFHGLLHPHLLQSGATEAEKRMTLPGDEVVPDASWIRTRAETVAAPPEQIWPWLAQLGADRGGWPGWYPFTRPHDTAAMVNLGFEIAAGDVLLEVVGPESSARWDVVSAQAPSYLVLHSCRTVGTGAPVRRSERKHWIDVSWAFAVHGQAGNSSRLIARTRGAVAPAWLSLAVRPLLWGDTVMQRELLAAIGRRAGPGSAVLHYQRTPR